jgi:hypothetical protein
MSMISTHENIGRLAAAAFASADQAEAALQALVDDGFSDEQIGIIGSTSEEHLLHDWLPQAEEASGDASGTHVAVGGLLGGLLGGAATFVIPGIGWAAGAGIIATTIAGGGFGGGLVGPLLDLDVKRDRAIYLNQRLEAGDIIITVHDNRAGDAQDILLKYGGKTANT